MPTLSQFQYAPVVAEMWKQHELWDGTYNLDDLLDAHEILDSKFENQIRAREYYEQERR